MQALSQTDHVACRYSAFIEPVAAFVHSKLEGTVLCPGSTDTELCWDAKTCLQVSMQVS